MTIRWSPYLHLSSTRGKQIKIAYSKHALIRLMFVPGILLEQTLRIRILQSLQHPILQLILFFTVI